MTRCLDAITDFALRTWHSVYDRETHKHARVFKLCITATTMNLATNPLSDCSQVEKKGTTTAV